MLDCYSYTTGEYLVLDLVKRTKTYLSYKTIPLALISSSGKKFLDTVAFLLVFSNYCPTMD